MSEIPLQPSMLCLACKPAYQVHSIEIGSASAIVSKY